jgi:hypothetical protein
MNCLRSLEHWDRGFEPTGGMDISLRLFCVCVVLCVGSGLAMGLSPVQIDLPTVYTELRNWKSGHGPTKGCRAIDRRPYGRRDFSLNNWFCTLQWNVSFIALLKRVNQTTRDLYIYTYVSFMPVHFHLHLTYRNVLKPRTRKEILKGKGKFYRKFNILL